MSPERSNSAVRNLRSIFENKASESSPNARGRSPGNLGDLLDDPRPRSKVRASFIPVQPTMAALAAEQQQHEAGAELKRESSAGQRRTSFSEGRSGDALELMKESVNAEQQRRNQESTVADTIPETAVESVGLTPANEINKQLGAALDSRMDKHDKEAENPDKPVTGAEEEPADMKPADPASEEVISGGQALPPVAEDLRKTASKDKASGGPKPSAISTKAAKGASSSIKSPSAPLSAGSATSAPGKKAGRSSLTAPTAASVARAAGGEKQTSIPPKPKPRESTKPVEVSSRLTAPTAASRARLESASAANTPPAATNRSKPTPAPTRPTPRPSLAGRPNSQASSASKKIVAPVDGSFLERMTRPTAASTNRSHDKTEVKSPPRQKQVPLRPKSNGQPKETKPIATVSKTLDETAVEPEEEITVAAVEEDAKDDDSFLPQYDQHQSQAKTEDVAAVEDPTNQATTAPAEEPVPEPESTPVPAEKASQPAGEETPMAHPNGVQDEATALLEATPAALNGEDAIR